MREGVRWRKGLAVATAVGHTAHVAATDSVARSVAEEFGEATKRDILAAVARLGPGGPVVIVVVSSGYEQFLDNWLCHMDALDIRRLIVVAMDGALAARLAGTGFPVVRAGFDGSRADFWLQRARIWAFLAAEGVEFIHSDVDAIWLRDPVRQYSDAAFDLLITQGTIYPRPALAAWGFVLCTGFFWARATAASRRLFDAFVTPAMLSSDDQAALNGLLIEAGTSWRTDGVGSYELRRRDHSFTCYREPIAGFCGALDLRLLLMPHHLFPRLQPGAPDAIVRHVLRDPSPELRIGLMRAAGCWRLDAYPDGFAIAVADAGEG